MTPVGCLSSTLQVGYVDKLLLIVTPILKIGFVKPDPASFFSSCPRPLAAAFRFSKDNMQVVVEVRVVGAGATSPEQRNTEMKNVL